MKLSAPTCRTTSDTSQADRIDAAIAEKSRVCRVLRMRVGAEMDDSALAEALGTTREQVCRWRRSNDRTAPSVLALLLADERLFRLLMTEILAARARLGHDDER